MQFSEIRYTRLKQVPHIHLYMSEYEYAILGYPNKRIRNYADFLNIFDKIMTDNLREVGRATFGIYPYTNSVDYIKIEVEDD